MAATYAPAMGTRQRQALLLGIIALVAALVLAVTAVHAHGLDCGTAISPTHPEVFGGWQCDSPITERRTFAIVAGLIGLVLTWGAVSDARWIHSPLRPTAPSPSEDEPTG